MSMQLDVVMPLDVDCNDRVKNARKVAEWLPHLKIIIAQCGSKFHPLEFPDNVTSIFLHSNNNNFNKCKAMNFGYKFARNPIVLQIDADCILHHDDIQNAYDTIYSEKADFVFPHNGKMIDIPKPYHHLEILKDIVAETLTPPDLVRKNPGIFAHGGAFMFRWRAFYQCGMENEEFFGYGSEDTERWLRLLRLNKHPLPGKHPFWHLNHDRPATDWYKDRNPNINSLKAYWWQNTDSNLEILEKVKQLQEDFDPGQIFA